MANPFDGNVWWSICDPNNGGGCLTTAPGVVDASQDVTGEYHGGVSLVAFGEVSSGSTGTQTWQLYAIDPANGVYVIRPQAYLTKLNLHYTSSGTIDVSNVNDNNYAWEVFMDPQTDYYIIQVPGNDNGRISASGSGDVMLGNQGVFSLSSVGNINDQTFSAVPTVTGSFPSNPTSTPVTTPAGSTANSPTPGVRQSNTGFPSSSSSSSSSSIPPGQTGSLQGTAVGSTPTNTTSSNSVNVGAVAGGAVGGVVVLLLLALVGVLLYRRRRASKKSFANQATGQNRWDNSGAEYGAAELDAVDSSLPTGQLASSPMLELSAESKPAELEDESPWLKSEKGFKD